MELQNPFEMLFAETLDAGGRSPRTQKSYVWMLRLLGRLVAKPLDQVFDPGRRCLVGRRQGEPGGQGRVLYR